MDRDQVLAEIRKRKVQLWLEPYLTNGSESNRASLGSLAKTLNGGSENLDEIVQILQELQTHAVDKLKSKACVQIKIAGLQNVQEQPFHLKAKDDHPWAALVEQKQEIGKASTSITLKLYQIRKDLSVESFLQNVQECVPDIDSLRLIRKGKVIASSDARLAHVLAPPCQALCLVSYQPEAKTSVIDSLRRAASRLSRDFDVTDQKGNHVSMNPSERKAFLTALGLHRLGRHKAKEPSESLLYLLQADYEWNMNIATHWRSSVDNYGLLQLDIAWTYLMLESMENLSDAMERLDTAERVLKKQVHSNFCTLALVQAEMGNPVPPLAAVFCRLFLLQGAAYGYAGDTAKSQERLDWAYAICCSLRSVCEEGKVRSLVDALNVEEFQIISALRRSNGNVDQAATLIQEEAQEEARKAETRGKQHYLGLCKNKTDYVNLEMVEQVQTVLGFSTTDTLDALDYQVSTGLLRLGNNDMQSCIDIYQEMERNPEGILNRVRDLDRELGLKRKKTAANVKVDEVALATLLSMGIDNETAETALKRTKNNVDEATVWLSGDQREGPPPNFDSPSEASFSGAASSSGSEASSPGRENSTIGNARKTPVGHNSKRLRISREIEEADRFAEEELKQSLQEHDLEKEYFGSKLDEEWEFLQKFLEKP